jgi:hypothetical protein
MMEDLIERGSSTSEFCRVKVSHGQSDESAFPFVGTNTLRQFLVNVSNRTYCPFHREQSLDSFGVRIHALRHHAGQF